VTGPQEPSASLDAWSAPYRGARALVFGGTGFLGTHVAAALARAGAQPHWTTRDRALAGPGALGFAGGRGHVADLRDERAVREVVAAVRPAIAFNLAGYGVDPVERDEVDAHLLNAAFVATAARALSEAPPAGESVAGRTELLRLVHVGSALEYGAAAGDLHESTEPRPTTLYGRTKLAGTQLLAEACAGSPLRAATARLFMVYGPGEREGRLLPSLLRAAAARAPIELTAGAQQRDFTFVGDAAEGLLRLGAAASVRPGEVVNLATGRLTSVRAFAETAARILGLPPELLRFGALATRGEEMSHAPVAVGRARVLLGWLPPTTVEEGLRRSAAAR